MSKFLKALEEADRYREAHEPAREPLRVMVTPDGDALAAETGKVARWIDEGQTLVHALASRVAEQDRLRARAEVAERESQRLREEAAEVGETQGKLLNETVRQLNEALQRLKVPQRRV